LAVNEIFERYRRDFITAWGIAPGLGSNLEKQALKARFSSPTTSDIKERRFAIAVLVRRRFQTAAP
jgi:hypothetical protein